MIDVAGLSKHYAHRCVVDDASFHVPTGAVTGFLGPNGAGKSTVIHMIVALTRPDSGMALIDGVTYQSLPCPLFKVGTVLDQSATNPAMTVRQHLSIMAASNGIAHRSVSEVLELVELSDARDRRIGRLSFGMRTRLALAVALLADPPTLILDEPTNGLDPHGIAWLRGLLRSLAARGRTVFVSSHLLAEIGQIADHLVVINKGRITATGPTHAILGSRPPMLQVRSPVLSALADQLTRIGGHVEIHRADSSDTQAQSDEAALVAGLSAAQVGNTAAHHGFALHELSVLDTDLAAVFTNLTCPPETPVPPKCRVTDNADKIAGPM